MFQECSENFVAATLMIKSQLKIHKTLLPKSLEIEVKLFLKVR